MKTNFIYALMGAIALTGTMGFTSCSDSDVAETNPNFDPETNSVVVDLALNISTANSPSTRMSSAATQATTSDQFRGISDAKLFSFAQTENNKSLSAPTTIGKRYDLAQLVSSSQISSTNSRRVLEMSLPLKTNTLVFYGRATKPTTGENGYSVDDLYGSFVSNPTNNTATDLNDITFSLSQRLSVDKLEEFQKIEKLLAGIITCIMNVDLSNVTEGVSASTKAGDNAYVYDLSADELTPISWAAYATSNGNQYALETQLGQAYIQMTTIRGNSGELRAASSEALIQTIQDLWSAINKVRCALPLSKEEAIAKRLAVEISDRISKYFVAGSIPSDGAAITNVHFPDNFSTIRTNFLEDPFWPFNEATADEAYKRSNYGLSSLSMSTTDLAAFPVNYGIPRGATHVKFDTDKKLFYYPDKFNTSGVGGVDFYVTDYLYPAELAYFGNSPVRVSDESHQSKDYPNGANNNAPATNPVQVGGWNNEASWSADWNKNYVTAASRSVAMKNDINYGTALLKTTVKYSTTTLRDNNHQIQLDFNPSLNTNGDYNDKFTGGENDGEYKTEPDKKIVVDGSSFELIGVVVGGQTRNVGWDFLPKKVQVGASEEYQYGFISDNAIPTSARQIPASGASAPNYTLVFDNYNASQEAQNLVYIALEFRNNSGEDFYGNYNMIRNGGTFYLIGQLDPNAASNLTKINWTSDEMTHYLNYHALPPYNTDGSTKKIDRVFIQDFMTTANFVIGPHSLKYAYMTVPDLRSSSLTLGLSVDVQWETGLNFNDIILGGNDY